VIENPLSDNRWRAGKEDFDMLKLFAGTLVVLSLAAVGANAAETGTKTFPTSSECGPRR
jgi:hypothetical protein